MPRLLQTNLGDQLPMVKWRPFQGEGAVWDAIICGLDGATLQQSHGWGEAKRRMGWAVIRLIALDGQGSPACAVQILVRYRASLLAICWIPGGPAGDVRLIGSPLQSEISKLVGVPFMYCRLNSLRQCSSDLVSLLEKGGWGRPYYRMTTGLTLDLDLRPEDSARLAQASGNWRHNLKRAAKYGLTVERWGTPLTSEIISIYREMEALKGLDAQQSHDEIEAIVNSVGGRLVFFRCLDREGRLIALRGCGILGKRAWDLFAAASPPARKVYASHALLWALTSECRKMGVSRYDLSGIDPSANKGVYDFKKGTGASPMEYVGEWEWANPPLLRSLANMAMRFRKAAF
jgi:hypothetical protein